MAAARILRLSPVCASCCHWAICGPCLWPGVLLEPGWSLEMQERVQVLRALPLRSRTACLLHACNLVSVSSLDSTQGSHLPVDLQNHVQGGRDHAATWNSFATIFHELASICCCFPREWWGKVWFFGFIVFNFYSFICLSVSFILLPCTLCFRSTVFPLPPFPPKKSNQA